MSIWSTTLDFAADDHDPSCDRWVPCTREEAEEAGHWMGGGGQYARHDPTRPCTCGAGPLAYQRSHVLPRADHPRAGYLDLASVAFHIGPDGRYDEQRDMDDHHHLPFLRLSARGSDEEPDTVVLDRRQAQELRDALVWFCDHMDPGATP